MQITHCLLLLLRLLFMLNRVVLCRATSTSPSLPGESEQELLLKRLMARPDDIVLILGPQSSGKTRLLREVLLGHELSAPVMCINGRSQKLSDGRVMSQVLKAELKVQKHALKRSKKGISYASQGPA